MRKIYWTCVETENGYNAMALSPANNGTCLNFTITDNASFMNFETFEKCEQYITQINKPYYHEYLGSAYELVYLDPTSEDWQTIANIWVNFYNAIDNLLQKIHTWQNMPRYKKIFKNFEKYVLGE